MQAKCVHRDGDRQRIVYGYLCLYRLSDPGLYCDEDRERVLHLHRDGQIHVYHHCLGVLRQLSRLSNDHIHSHVLQVLSGP